MMYGHMLLSHHKSKYRDITQASPRDLKCKVDGALLANMSWSWPCGLATKIILNSSQLFHLLSIWSGTLRGQYQKGVVTLWLYEKTPPEFLLAGKDEPILRAPYKAFLYREINNTKPGWFFLTPVITGTKWAQAIIWWLCSTFNVHCSVHVDVSDDDHRCGCWCWHWCLCRCWNLYRLILVIPMSNNHPTMSGPVVPLLIF